MSSLEKLEKMYDSEINFRLECFWDGGFSWYLGDEMNGFKEAGHTLTIQEAIAELALAAHRKYPQSKFHLGNLATGVGPSSEVDKPEIK
jgi:hypothetical protein